jgi:hypothetical protein
MLHDFDKELSMKCLWICYMTSWFGKVEWMFMNLLHDKPYQFQPRGGFYVQRE